MCIIIRERVRFIVCAPMYSNDLPREMSEHCSIYAARREAKKYHATVEHETDVEILRVVGRKHGSRDMPDGRQREFVEYAGPVSR